MKHWRTTVAGVLTIIGALCTAGLAFVHHQPINWAGEWTAIAAGIGLIKSADAKNVVTKGL